MSAPKTDLQVWLEFIGAFLWPLTVLIALAMFARQIRSLLERLSSFKFGDTEVAFQTPSTDSDKKKTPVNEANLVRTGAETFLTETGIRDLVRESGLLAAADEIYRAVRIFSTTKQNTWLAFSRQKLFCILDDEKTRSSGRLIQWSLPRGSATPIQARPYKGAVGLLDIGARTNWLYSTRLFPSPEVLQREIASAIEEGGEKQS